MKNLQTDIQVENNRRLTMWAKLKDIEKKRKLKNEHLTPNDVREVGCYVGIIIRCLIKDYGQSILKT